MKNKVYILDHELISPIAVGKENIVSAIKSNLSADSQIENFETEGLPFRNAAEVKTELSSLYADESAHFKEVAKLDRRLELIAAAYGKAKDRIEPIINKINPSRAGVILGVGAESIPLKEFEEEVTGFIDDKMNAVCELIATLNKDKGKLSHITNPYDLYAVYLAQKFNAHAFHKSILTACVSSTQAIAQAYDAISRDQVDVVIAGGTDSIINLIALISFGKLGVIAESDDKISCRPFDQNRYGTIAGEAAGFVILASEKFIKENNFKPLASIIGYGNTLDGYKITAPDPSAKSMSRAIQNAMNNAGITAKELDYYYAHGTGTRQNDGVELEALRQVFGASLQNIPISSTKDRHGHAIAAAGIQELSILIELMKHSLIPSNMNMLHPIDENLNLVKKNLNKKIDYALTSNFAFGGINTVLAIKNEK